MVGMKCLCLKPGVYEVYSHRSWTKARHLKLKEIKNAKFDLYYSSGEKSNQKGISIQLLSNACPSFFCACLYLVGQMPSFVKYYIAKWLSWWEIVFCKAQSSQNNESDGIWFLSCLLLFAPRPIMSVIGKYNYLDETNGRVGPLLISTSSLRIRKTLGLIPRIPSAVALFQARVTTILQAVCTICRLVLKFGSKIHF